MTAKTVNFKRLLLQTVSFSVNEQVSLKRVLFEKTLSFQTNIPTAIFIYEKLLKITLF